MAATIHPRGVEAALRGNPLSSVSLAIFRAFYRRRMVEQLASGPYHDFLAEVGLGDHGGLVDEPHTPPPPPLAPRQLCQ